MWYISDTIYQQITMSNVVPGRFRSLMGIPVGWPSYMHTTRNRRIFRAKGHDGRAASSVSL